MCDKTTKGRHDFKESVRQGEERKKKKANWAVRRVLRSQATIKASRSTQNQPGSGGIAGGDGVQTAPSGKKLIPAIVGPHVYFPGLLFRRPARDETTQASKRHR